MIHASSTAQFAKRLVLCFLALLLISCGSSDKKVKVDTFHGRPNIPKTLPRTMLGDIPTGPFESQIISGILIMDSGCDYDTATAITYLTHLTTRYMTNTKSDDIPFHYFIDENGVIYSGRQEFTPAELHQNDPFLNRMGELDKTALFKARLGRRNNPLINLKGYVVICVLGDYEKKMITKEQEKSLFQLIASITYRNYMPLDQVKALSQVYPETHNPGFYLRNYVQPSTLQKNIPTPPTKHPFLISPSEIEKKKKP